MNGELRDTCNLIGSDRVEGTNVFGANREKIGTIERLMINKESGQVAYAVLRFGGILGFGDEHYPLPWGALTYDPTLGGYRADVTEAQLKEAPRVGRSEAWVGDDADRNRVDAYYSGRS